MSRFVVAACTFLMCLCIATLLAGGGFGGPCGSVYDRCDTNARSLYWAARNKQAQPTP